MDEICLIRTDRLVLRGPVREDAEALHAILSDPRVCFYTPNEPLRADADTLFVILEWRERLEEGLRPFVISRLDDPSGVVGFISATADQEIAGAIAPDQAGTGLAGEAIEALVNGRGLEAAWTVIDAENAPLIRTLERGSIQTVRRLPRYRVHPLLSAEPRDCVLLRRV